MKGVETMPAGVVDATTGGLRPHARIIHVDTAVVVGAAIRMASRGLTTEEEFRLYANFSRRHAAGDPAATSMLVWLDAKRLSAR